MTKTRRPLNDLNVVEQQQQQQRSNECQWLHRLINRRSYRISVLVFVCVLNVVDLFVDWYFFMSKATIQKVTIINVRLCNTSSL